ncbi:MAG: glucose-6-phosphate isomerase [Planctomycetes bacterium]|nr:glucose-6-phosphate isomerase [Planctomycetota bacterium]
MKSQKELWDAFRRDLSSIPSVGFSVDVSRMDLSDAWVSGMSDKISRSYDEMDRLERGERVNTDEDRMVGHYWLRDPGRAPTSQLRDEITNTLNRIKSFASDVHGGKIRGEKGQTFTDLIVVGIGGSALGPEFVADSLGTTEDKMRPHFIDNTDGDGIDRAFVGLDLNRTLTVVISKSGGTKETRNGMLESEARYKAAGLNFGKHAVAVTGDGSELDKFAIKNGWITRFPMWDWVGGRTSELSAVGLLPAALQGIDIDAILSGARAVDEVTRVRSGRPLGNPAMALTLAWYAAGDGRGKKDMVILPYKDRLALFSRYLQQLVMESLGKEKDRKGEVVHQGIAVYGNKGSTDQHAYVQQLRDGVHNFFIVFIEVLRDRGGKSLAVEPDVTSGDYLSGFYQGTRRALYESGRQSITITIPEVSARTVGALIALYERAVGLYGAMVGINAYHQPGVEAGKKAAATVLAVQGRILKSLRERKGAGLTAEELASAIGSADEVETVFKICEHMAANPDHGVSKTAGDTPFSAKYKA